MKIKLTHYCHMAGVKGLPGAIIEVTDKNRKAADEIVRRGGAEWVGRAAVEAAVTEAPENAAMRTAPPPARPGK